MTNEELDEQIFHLVRSHEPMRFVEIREKAPTGWEDTRAIDRALQRLRKAKRLAFVKGRGWMVPAKRGAKR